MRFFSLLRPAFWITLFCFTLFLPSLVSAQDKDWRPLVPAELSMAAPSVEPDADAEALIWEIRIDDSDSEDLSLKHYVRVKIFTERGRDKYSKFDVPFTKGIKIKDLAARVIKSDGSIIEIKKEDIFEREIIKANGIKIKAKSFAVPNIEPGVIIEYRYKESISDASARGMRLQFQRDIPIQKIAYYYKPYNSSEPRTQTYNFTDAKFVKDKNGFWLATRTAVPAFKEEPRMPPEDNVRAWMMLTGTRLTLVDASAFSVSFTFKDPGNPRQYWGAVGTENAGLAKFMNKESGDVKKAAAEITAGAATAEEKLKKIYEYCQTQIANTTFDTSITDEQRAKLPAAKSLNDVLKRKAAGSQYVDLLFGALANASGFETRIALIGDRSKMFIEPEMTDENLIHPGAIAVKVNEEWKYFNPGVKFLPYGMLLWHEEDTWALLVGEKRFDWKKTPLTGYEASNTKRNGKFTLLEDGTLEGDVSIEMKGQPGLMYRMENYDETPVKLEEDIRQDVRARISTAEVTGMSVENLADGTKPLIQRYKIRVPNYAQKTGKRLFVQPSFFKYGTSPIFSSSTRKYDIFFRYPWSESDTIDIKWPAGFDLDSPDSPATVADAQKIGSLVTRITAVKAENRLNYSRKFHFGGGGAILFGVENYQVLKTMFDQFNKADTHTITLKQK